MVVESAGYVIELYAFKRGESWSSEANQRDRRLSTNSRILSDKVQLVGEHSNKLQWNALFLFDGKLIFLEL